MPRKHERKARPSKPIPKNVLKVPPPPANRGGASPTGRPSDDLLGADLDLIGLHDLASRARAGEFNDYFGEHTMPQHMLVSLVRTDSRGSYDQRQWLVGNVIDGKYDGTQEEADEWVRSDEGREAFGALFEGGRPVGEG